MDPATALAAIKLATQSGKDVYTFYNNWQEAPKDVQSYVDQIRTLSTRLDLTESLLEKKHFRKALVENPVLDLDIKDALLRYSNQLQELSTNLRSERTSIAFKKAYNSKSLRKSMDDVNRHCEQLHGLLETGNFDLVADLKTDFEQDQAERRKWRENDEIVKILDWLSNLDFEETQHTMIKRRKPDTTGEWFLSSDAFVQWRNNRQIRIDTEEARVPSILWAHGKRKSSIDVIFYSACTILHKLPPPSEILPFASP